MQGQTGETALILRFCNENDFNVSMKGLGTALSDSDKIDVTTRYQRHEIIMTPTSPNASRPSRALPPGVVTGDDYLALIEACKAGGYALPAINVVGTDSVNAVLEAAARNNSDVIVQCSNGGARFYAGEGLADQHKARVLGAAAMRAMSIFLPGNMASASFSIPITPIANLSPGLKACSI